LKSQIAENIAFDQSVHKKEKQINAQGNKFRGFVAAFPHQNINACFWEMGFRLLAFNVCLSCV
jgi:hypothetical protein